MTILEGIFVGVVTLFIGWALTPFGKPFRQAIEDWLYRLDAHTKARSPLKIEFEGESNVRWLTENNPIFRTQKVQRKFYGIGVFNSGGKDVDDVSVEIERIEPVSVSESPYLGLKCRFKLNGQPRMKFSPGLRDHVPLISHTSGMSIDYAVRVESTQGYTFHHNNEKHRLHVKLTGNEAMAVTECFTAWVNEDGVLTMVRG